MRILALDLGERRIGVAVSDALGCLARPLKVLRRKSHDIDTAAIEELVRELQAEQLVVGYPRSLSGSVGPQAERVQRYVDRLRERLQVPVILWDERLSTAHAERLVREAGKRVRRESIDAAAAAVILQSYLDAPPTARGQITELT